MRLLAAVSPSSSEDFGVQPLGGSGARDIIIKLGEILVHCVVEIAINAECACVCGVREPPRRAAATAEVGASRPYATATGVHRTKWLCSGCVSTGPGNT